MTEILAKADAALSGARAETYGSPGPEDSTGLICSLWSAYLSDALKTKIIISRREFCSMMVLLKVARDAHAPKEDNLVDIAGYAALAQPDASVEGLIR